MSVTPEPSLQPPPPLFCENSTHVAESGHPATSTLMFALGVLGNLLALGILGVHRRERRARATPFCILVTGLASTDLLGTCVLSPVVFVSYARKESLLELGGAPLCKLFAFAMTFFNLSSMMILLFMSLERCLAVSHPYAYAQHNWGRRLARASLPSSYTLPAALCALPLLGVGEHKQFCPGTWCFVRMAVAARGAALLFSLLYATLTGLLILAILLCNASATVSLCHMRKGQRARRESLRRCRARGWFLGAGEEELEHLILLVLMTIIFMVCSVPMTYSAPLHNILLVLMTVIFMVCSMPMTLRAFLGAFSRRAPQDELGELLAFRLSALNPILDPWIFIIFRGSVFRKLRSLLCPAHRAAKPVPVESRTISPITSIAGT